ncbi:MAG TPA: hypothetical protein PK737_03370 [Bacilli bacterium]|nr:hypothetical protein [Bacilli bacterium]
MKKVLTLIITCGLLILLALNIDPIANQVVNFLEVKKSLVILPENKYTKNQDYLFVQKTKDFVPYGYQDLLNIIYSTLDNGWTSFTFYCPTAYVNCIKDVKKLAGDSNILADINNYVHPFNGYKNVIITYDDSGEINIEIAKVYNPEQINAIEKRVKAIIKDLNLEGLAIKDQILLIHDYMINHAQYDFARIDEGSELYHSDIAYGPLFEGWAICSGYTDLMAIFLNELGVTNFKVSSEKHTWNAVLLDNVWYHLDVTWDDPASSNGLPNLFHNYFLIIAKED